MRSTGSSQAKYCKKLNFSVNRFQMITREQLINVKSKNDPNESIR